MVPCLHWETHVSFLCINNHQICCVLKYLFILRILSLNKAWNNCCFNVFILNSVSCLVALISHFCISSKMSLKSQFRILSLKFEWLSFAVHPISLTITRLIASIKSSSPTLSLSCAIFFPWQKDTLVIQDYYRVSTSFIADVKALPTEFYRNYIKFWSHKPDNFIFRLITARAHFIFILHVIVN